MNTGARSKIRAELVKPRATERHRREDFCARTAHTNGVVVVEDLKTKQLTRRAKPVEDPDNPGHFMPNGVGQANRA